MRRRGAGRLAGGIGPRFRSLSLRISGGRQRWRRPRPRQAIEVTPKRLEGLVDRIDAWRSGGFAIELSLQGPNMARELRGWLRGRRLDPVQALASEHLALELCDQVRSIAVARAALGRRCSSAREDSRESQRCRGQRGRREHPAALTPAHGCFHSSGRAKPRSRKRDWPQRTQAAWSLSASVPRRRRMSAGLAPSAVPRASAASQPGCVSWR